VGTPEQDSTPPGERLGGPAPRQERPARPRGAGRELRRAPAEQEQSQTHQILVYVNPATKAAAERHRRQHRVTNGELVLDALDATYDDLPELVAAGQTAARSDDSLFPARRATRRASSPATRKVAFAFRATATELTIVQDMVRDFGATSQSELVAVAMDRYLLPPRGRRS
jgi:hypothetical protein